MTCETQLPHREEQTKLGRVRRGCAHYLQTSKSAESRSVSVCLQAVSGYAGRLLCASMQAAVAWYPMQQFAATAQPGQLEQFYDKREADDQLAPPAWHKPSPEEVGVNIHMLPVVFYCGHNAYSTTIAAESP